MLTYLEYRGSKILIQVLCWKVGREDSLRGIGRSLFPVGIVAVPRAKECGLSENLRYCFHQRGPRRGKGPAAPSLRVGLFWIIVAPLRRTIMCHSCEKRLTDASNAMRHHANVMHAAIQWARSGGPEEQRKDYNDRLVASLNDAQSAWDAYRQHLIEHGLLGLLPAPAA